MKFNFNELEYHVCEEQHQIVEKDLFTAELPKAHCCAKPNLLRSPPLIKNANLRKIFVMKINGNAIRPGMVIEHQGRLWRAVKIQHTQPGKGGAYLQVELKDVRDGRKLNERFRASETVERARLEQNQYQYLFSDGDMHTFMHGQTFEQISLNSDLIGTPQIKFLQEGMQAIIETFEENPIGVQLPPHAVFEVVEADAVVKGQTAASSYKPAVLNNGLRTMVPPHIETGTRIVISTEDGSYVERAKD